VGFDTLRTLCPYCGLWLAYLMRLIIRRIEATKQGAGNASGIPAYGWPPRLRNQHGFTLVELVMAMVIIGILAAVVAPRFFDSNVFRSRGFADQAQASLRYAQKVAIAQHRFVCAAFTASSITFTTGATAACGTPLASPTGDASYVVNVPSGIAFGALPTNFSFDALGRPSTNQTITIVGATNPIIVEAETGYVHSP
jgi:MSHA pilin protein MshC